MRILRCADYRRMAWKNGGGLTQEIAREPPQGEFYQWRLSMAQIDMPGPFSDFSGYTRVMILLSGAGLTLKCAGAADRTLSRPGDMLKFDGGLAIQCELRAGSCTDLNLMVNQQHGVDARVETLNAPLVLRAPAGGVALVVAMKGHCSLRGASSVRLAAYDTAILADGEDGLLSIEQVGSSAPQAFVAYVGAAGRT